MPDQLRREFAVRSLRWWVPIAAVTGISMGLLGHQEPIALDSRPIDQWPTVFYAALFLWMIVTIYLLNAGFATRCSGTLDVSLPLDARHLWLVHISAIVVSIVVILGLVVAGFAAINAVLGNRPLTEPGLISLVVHIGAGSILALAVMQVPEPSVYEIPARGGYVFLVVTAVLGFLGLSFLLSSLPRYWAIVPLAVAVGLGVRIYRRLPRGLTLLPRAATPGGWPEASGAARAAGDAGGASPGSGLLLVSSIWRNPFGNWALLYVPVFVFHGVVLSLSGPAANWHNMHVPYLFFTWMVLTSWLLASKAKLFLFDPLPVSRKLVFAVLTLPALLAVGVGHWGGSIGATVLGTAPPPVDLRTGPDHHDVVVPGDLWRISWNGELPSAGSPWGESAAPCCGRPLVSGGVITVYESYDAPLNSSADFVALQLSRAVEAVYGTRIPFEEIRERYLLTDADGSVRLRDTGLSIRSDYPDLRPRSRSWDSALDLVLIGLPWFVFAGLVYRMDRIGRLERAARLVLAGSFFTIAAAGLVTLALGIAGFLDLAALGRFLGILARQATQSAPLGSFTIWAVAVLLLAVGYLFAQRQFVRMEITVQQGKK